MSAAPDPGRRALDHLAKVLADKPHKNGHELSAALRCLAAYRNGFIAARRERPDDPRGALVESVNGVISSVLAAQFPLGEIEWEEVVRAKGWLAGVVDSCP